MRTGCACASSRSRSLRCQTHVQRLVAHGGVLDVLYRLATGQELQAPRTWQLTNAAINRLLWTPEGLTLVGWADTQHLDTATRDETTT